MSAHKMCRMIQTARNAGLSTLADLAVLFRATTLPAPCGEDLVAITGITGAGMTGVVDKLEGKGLVQRARAADRRKLAITATALGAELAEELLTDC